jgi:hypothetical protein
MELLAVIYTVGGFAREDASKAAIAGIFTDPKIAETVRKAAGYDAKVVTVTLDKIAPGYINFAKEVLNIDLAEILQEKELGLREFSDLDKRCLMSAEEFMQDEESGGITGDDGHGYWATDKKVSNVSCWREKPEWATHVCWYNR